MVAIVDAIQEKLATLTPESVEILDESGLHVGHAGARDGGGHYQLVIVSGAFSGQPLQARHRMVYAALGTLMHREIHALAIKAYAPDEI
ncbi:MAG: BolA family transcriptional regulator [Burkholderiales bacterium]|nr:BolA family transcriptional regulator [Burkholderiales bacterium]